MQFGRWSFDQPRELSLVPVLDGRPPGRHLLFHLLPLFHQQRIFCVLGNLIHLQLVAVNLDVVLVRECKDVSFGIELRPAGSTKYLMRDAGVDQRLLTRRTFQQIGHQYRSSGQVHAGCQCFCANANRQQLLLEEILDDPLVPRQDAGVVNSDTAQDDRFELRADAL